VRVERVERGGRLFRLNGGNDRVENCARELGATTRQSSGRIASVGKKANRFLILVRRDETTFLVDSFFVLLNGDADDVRDPLNRMLLLSREAERQAGKGEHGHAAELGCPIHCRGNISGFQARV
jgi:hypothetical protein